MFVNEKNFIGKSVDKLLSNFLLNLTKYIYKLIREVLEKKR